LKDGELTATIAEATAECGMQVLANWVPSAWHAELRELLNDLTVGALTAYRDAKQKWHEPPEPSVN
jgi:hypothetical protein